MKTFRLYRTESTCQCTHDCHCEPDVGYHLKIDGASGYGSAAWVMDVATGEEMFACRFLGWEFTASSGDMIRRELEHRLNLIRDEPTTVEVW